MESILYDSKNAQVYKYGLYILDYVPRDMNQNILDIGCGSGALTKELTNYGNDVIGIDISINNIRNAHAKYPTVPFYVMDACRLQYASRFDVVFSNATFHEIYDKDKLFRSINKALKMNGKIIAEFASPNGNTEYFAMVDEILRKYNLDERKKTIHLISEEDCLEKLAKYGFEVEHFEEYSRKTYVRGDDNSVRAEIEGTLSHDIPKDIRDAIIEELMSKCIKRFKTKRGWLKDVCRFRLVARKDRDV